MLRQVYNETTNNWEEFDTQIRGVVYIDKDHAEYGYFSKSDDYKLVMHSYVGAQYFLTKGCNIDIYYDRASGRYTNVKPTNEITFGHGNFPYSFDRYYSTRYLEKMFESKFKLDSPIKYKYINELPYTFGFEFETSAGYIPEDVLYKIGLIPLRDGSITGLEYSTIILKGNDGINTLRKQLEVLNDYTIFDFNCSLHINFGSFKLTPKTLLRLNNLFALSNIKDYLVPYAFDTSKYKSNKKDYCKRNIYYNTFEDMYRHNVGVNFFGDLYQPHPNDLSGNRKWNISTRYTALNLINAMCYNNSKTAEFRMLRPTYNFNKILIWLFVLGAFIKYAENDKLRGIQYMSIERIIKSVYSVELANILIHALSIQKDVVQTQILVEDYCGQRVDIENQIMTYNNLSLDNNFFY